MGDATVAVRLLRGSDLTYQRVRVPVMSFMRDFSIQWPVSVESMWTGAGTASSLPVHAGFIQCALQWSLYDRFLVAATTPITCAVILLLIPGYQLMCRAKDRLESTRNMQAAAQASSHHHHHMAKGTAWQMYQTGLLVLWYLMYVVVCLPWMWVGRWVLTLRNGVALQLPDSVA